MARLARVAVSDLRLYLGDARAGHVDFEKAVAESRAHCAERFSRHAELARTLFDEELARQRP
jgi:hypothetical protein